VLAVIEAERVDSFHLLGCSMGTVIARHFVGQRGGERLRSLSLLCPPNGVLATEADMKAAVFWDPAKPLVESERGAWPVLHPMAWIAGNEAPLLAAFYAKLAEPTPPLTYHVQFEEAVAAGDPNAALAQSSWPMLILHGTIDRLVPPENARLLAKAVPRAQLRWLEGDGHNFWQHDPDRSAEAVLAFLDDAEASR
jgi:pimeloyl-ACP methyl ester carboxylesterase